MSTNLVDLCSPSPLQTKSTRIANTASPSLHIRVNGFDDLPTREAAHESSIGEVPPDAASGNPSKKLTKAQWTIVKLAKSGESFFFSGCAGTGKTFTLMSVIEALPQTITYVTALTGIAASLLPRGTTLHSFAGIGHGSLGNEQMLKKVKSNPQAVGKWTKAKTLIIDEVSMMSRELFELIDYLGRELRSRRTVAFGGLQVILCGDFFQLPPVSNAIKNYCFESPLWTEAIGDRSYELVEIFRQKDPRLINLLSDIRYGTISDETNRLLTSLRRNINLPRGIVPTQLVPVNSTADAINIRELEKLTPEPAVTYVANDWGADAYALDMLDKITLFPERLPLRVGAQVMLLKNNASVSLWNGSRGLVIGFYDKRVGGKDYDIIEGCPKASLRYDLLPIVRFSSGQEVVVGYDSFELEGPGRQKLRACRQQLPLRLSWAITIHKSQGMSLDYLMVDASRSFEAGQAYVALSRARSLEGLQVLSFDPRKCWCDAKVVAFYSTKITKLNESECDAVLMVSRKTKGRKRKTTDWLRKPDDDIDAWLAEAAAADEKENATNIKAPPNSILGVMSGIAASKKITTPAANFSSQGFVEEKVISAPSRIVHPTSPPRLPAYSAAYAFRAACADNPPVPSGYIGN